ncbi:MAG: hypothetical protein LC795_08645 [Acidobacteria bacterium]|nr:hypothetical protein [Acidobacteriota bacterium]
MLNRKFTLKVGHEALVRPGGLKVRFGAVLEDSRCPEGVDCIWSGNARIAAELSGAGGKPASVELNSDVEPRRQSYMQYEVSLLGLAPRPREGEKIDPKSYVATLLVKKK